MPIPRVERFSGDGSNKTFVTAGPATGTVLVFVDGPLLSPSGYSVDSDAKTYHLKVPPQAGTNNVTFRYFEADS